ncbi:hypothetical protein ES703_87975 [subsurface metagenome]
MDTSEQYIKMCDCLEIQGKWKPEEGDFYVPLGKDYINGHGSIDVVSGVRAIREEKRIEYLTGGIYERLAWLPRQDQVQEIWSPTVEPWFGVILAFISWFETINPDKYQSVEQLWLAFYMYEKHKKTWTGERWVA